MENQQSVTPLAQQQSVAGYSGTKYEGQAAPTRPTGASANAVVTYTGALEPTAVYAGDGHTPKP